MFDIGFWEICMVCLVALLVFGPDKLPQAARTAGLWVGRARRIVANLQQDIDRELHLQEIRDSIKQNEQHGLHQFLEETKTSLSDLGKSVNPTTPATTVATTTPVDQAILPSINNPISITDLSRKP